MQLNSVKTTPAPGRHSQQVHRSCQASLQSVHREGPQTQPYLQHGRGNCANWERQQEMHYSSRGLKMKGAGNVRVCAQVHHVSARRILMPFPAMIMAACSTIIFLAAAALCIFLLLRPLVKRLESLAVACEAAAKEVEKASAEFALASVVINSDLPTTLDSMERASLEFEELGQSLNGLTGALRRTKPSTGKPGAKAKMDSLSKIDLDKESELDSESLGDAEAEALHEWSAVEAIQASTVNSMRKVAQDVSALATALTPAMVTWKKRLSFITERFEASPKADAPMELPAAAALGNTQALTEGEKGHLSDAASPLHKVPEDAKLGEGSDESSSLSQDVEFLQERVMSKAEHGEVSSVANELAQAAAEVTDVARASLESRDEDSDSDFKLSPEQHKEGTDLLEKAAIAAQALTREAQKAAEVESKFKALKDIAPLAEDLDALALPDTPPEDDGGLDDEMEDRRQAAEAVFAALANAEEAASAAAAASGALETALQKAEEHAGISWWGWNHNLFRQSSKKKHSRADAAEIQEHDGMAYPCSRYIASRETGDTDSSAKPTPATGTKS